MNTDNTERRCLWCMKTPSEVASSGLFDEPMTFANGNRNTPCNFCTAALSKRHGDTSQRPGQSVYARRKGLKTPRPGKLWGDDS